MYNHAHMQELLDIEIDRARRHKHVLSVLMFDLDHFKRVNDEYGHQAGDLLLKRIAEVVAQTIRSIDMAARYGGEEFLLILPETGHEGALRLAERLRSNVSQAKTSIPGGGELSVTISIGVVTCDACFDHYDKQQIVNEVDNALYASKGAGRNRVTAVTLKGDVCMKYEQARNEQSD
jgi:diguanylate cyclase (GGDEF)-like protein